MSGAPIGCLADAGPYRAWKLRDEPAAWAVRGAGGWNCWGLDGATLLDSRETAERVIRSHGHEPGEPIE